MSNPSSLLCVAATLCLAVFFANWLTRFSWGKSVGTPIFAILICAVLANTGLIPSAMDGHPIYDGVFTYIAPLGIFIALLEVDLKSLKKAGLPLLLLFLLGSLATVIGVLTAWVLVQPAEAIGPLAPAVAGMYTGTYIGGAINFNAIALHYKVNEAGTLFAATTVVDNLVGTPWIIATLILPKYLQKLFPRKKNETAASGEKSLSQESISISSISSLLALALLEVGDLAFTLILFVTILILVHGLVVFGVGALFKMDWDMIAVASQANIGGTTTALASAESLQRPDLLIPGILVGSLGNAIGTYIGFAVASGLF